VERDLEFSVEALALYIRAWLAATPPLPEGAQAAAAAKGRDGMIALLRRWDGGWPRAAPFS